jgi:hypothetical protein
MTRKSKSSSGKETNARSVSNRSDPVAEVVGLTGEGIGLKKGRGGE